MSSTARVQAMQKPSRARFWAQRRACGLELGITSPNRGYPGHPLGNGYALDLNLASGVPTIRDVHKGGGQRGAE